MSLWNVDGAIVRPNGMTRYANMPHLVANVVLCWSWSAMDTWLSP